MKSTFFLLSVARLGGEQPLGLSLIFIVNH